MVNADLIGAGGGCYIRPAVFNNQNVAAVPVRFQFYHRILVQGKNVGTDSVLLDVNVPALFVGKTGPRHISKAQSKRNQYYQQVCDQSFTLHR